MRSLLSTLKGIKFSVIAPSEQAVFPGMQAWPDSEQYERLIGEIQRFRGMVYVQEGILLPTDLDAQGRHQRASDFAAWHLVLRDRPDHILGAMWLRVHDLRGGALRFEDLQIYEHIARANDEQLASALDTATRHFLAESAKNYKYFSEVGGWAIREEVRRTALAPILAASLWSLARIVGGGTGLAIARVRHQCADVLKRMGGMDLYSGGEPLPRFYDSFYRDMFEVIGFDSQYSCQQLEPTIEDIRAYLCETPILTTPSLLSLAARSAPLLLEKAA